MGNELPNVAIWGYGVAAGAYSLFSLYLFLAWRGGITGAALTAAAASSALWASANVVFLVWPVDGTNHAALLFDVINGGAWFFFLLVLLRPLSVAPMRWTWIAAIAVVFAQAMSVVLFVFGVEFQVESGRVVLAWFLAGAVLGLVLVEQLYRGLPVESRWGLKPLCLALAAGYVFDLYLYADGFLFGRVDADVWSVRGVVHAMLIPMIALSAARSPSWTMKISVSRDVAFHSTALGLSGLYLLAIAGAGYYVRYFGGDWGRALQLALLFGGLLLLVVFIFSGTQRAKLRVLINKHLFSYRYDYRSEWLRFTQALSAAGDSMDLGQSVIKALADLVESSGGLLWLRDGSGRFTMHARLNQPPSDASTDANSAFCRFLDEQEWIVNLEEFRGGVAAHREVEVPEWLSSIPDAWLVVPLKSPGFLVGFVVLSTARTKFEINWEVLDLLKTAQRQAASYLARMQATDALLESRKFDSFNRMSAFVVHDLKNLVSQMSLMVKNAERHRDNPEFQQDMIDMVVHVESRMRSLMSQLQEKTSIEAHRTVAIVPLLERVVLNKRHQCPAVRISAEGAADCVVNAHPERLERVLGHLVQNALDATPEDGNVSVEVDASASGELRMVVSDNGCGMSETFVREQLFRPFHSSKASGMGIGMYEAQQYVHELGGQISVHSTEGEGTRISVSLPCVHRDLRQAGAATSEGR